MSAERWLPIPGFPLYEVSDAGRVRSHQKWRGLPTPRLIVLHANPTSSYMQVRLRGGDGSYRTATVHKLVMLTFVGPRPSGMEVRHLDGDRQHNHLQNLRYGTPSENCRDALEHGTQWPAVRAGCSKGHDYTPENTAIYSRPDGSTYRQCRTCHRQHGRAAKARAKARRLAQAQPRAA